MFFCFPLNNTSERRSWILENFHGQWQYESQFKPFHASLKARKFEEYGLFSFCKCTEPGNHIKLEFIPQVSQPVTLTSDLLLCKEPESACGGNFAEV